MANDIKRSDLVIPIFLLSLLLPITILPLERLINYPEVIEEVAKMWLLLLALKFSDRKIQILTVILPAFLFSLSENVFYITNFVTNLGFRNFLQLYPLRFISATIFHTTTALVAYFLIRKSKLLLIPSLALMITMHYLFNKLILVYNF